MSNSFIMTESIVRPAKMPYGRLKDNGFVGIEGEHAARALVVETKDDLSAFASINLIIDDLDCGAMTKTTSGSTTTLSMTLTSSMIGRSGRKICQLIMVNSDNTVVQKSSQFEAYVGRANEIERSVDDGVTIIILSEAVTEMAQEAAAAAAQEAAADVVEDCQAIADAASASADAAAQSASDAQAAAASIVVDATLDNTSTHAIQNKVVASEIAGLKADLSDNVNDLKSAIEQQRGETTTSDILITDESGFIGARIEKGFNSSDVLQKDDVPDWIADGASAISVADKSGNIAVSVEKNMQPRFVSNLTGKRISVLGDSISTYDAVGYKMPAIEDDHTQFFPRYNVNSLDKMWYSIVCKTIGASMLKSASWGGSMVSGTGSIADGKPGWSDARIAALADGSTVPDIVLVEMGTNDFDAGKALGIFDGTSPLPTTIQTGGTFSDAYALMISKIHAAYPMARIVCLTIPARKSVNDVSAISNPEYPVTNSQGLCVDDYNNVIRNIAHYMNCSIADTYACGINPWNIPLIESGASYGTILGDRFVHPNVEGMRMMAETVVNTLRKM